MCKKVVVLLSCMYQKSHSIIARSHIQTDAIIINQCDIDSIEEIFFKNFKDVNCKVIFISTTQRGLSNSRNMAITNAPSDSIGIICDEDEVLADNYEELVLEGYDSCCNPDIVAFKVGWNGFGKKYSHKPHKLSYIQSLRICSVQISFKIGRILEKQIFFDPLMGSGSGNGAGEENKFILDCRRNGMRLFYYPNEIATISQGESQWFKGFDNKYFENFGWSARRIHNNIILTAVYLFYYAISKRKLYKGDNTFIGALKAMYKGMFTNNSIKSER